jgi:LysM repeat protein
MGMGQKAQIKTEKGDTLDCLFNPSQLEISLGTSWSGESVPGREAPELKYNGGNSGTMSLELFFDTTNTGKSVTVHTNKLMKMLKVDKTLSGYDEAKNNGRPPWVKFHWGKFHSFKSVITSLSISYVYFSSTGDPLRARVNLTLTQMEVDDAFPAQNPTSGTPAPGRAHQVLPGETLDRISARYYGDSTQWRAIARANAIRDPFALRPGVMLDIPTLEV